MTQPEEGVTFVSTDGFIGVLPEQRDKGPLGFRELTEDELAEMEGDDPGTGMTEAEIDAFLSQEIAEAVAEEPAAVGPSDQPEEA